MLGQLHPKLDHRLKLLRQLLRREHVIVRVRRLTIALTLLCLAAVPLSGLARVDLWNGAHRLAGKQVGIVMGLGGAIAGIIGFYVITFVVNWGFGRIFCGFGCPVGHTFRFADHVHVALQKKEGRARNLLEASLFALALSGSVVLWWVDPAVLWRGSAGPVAVTLGSWAGVGAAIVAFGHFWRWSFCQSWCPIGIYYTAVQLPHRFGVEYRPVGGECNTCTLCVTSCPVGLDPRHLAERLDDRGALALDGFPGHNYCLTCGDCVRACDFNHRKRPGAARPLSLALSPSDEEPGDDTAER